MPTEKKTTQKTKTDNSKKPKESKEAIFIRLAKPRVQNVLRALRILGNCSNKSNYTYTSEQINKMFTTISDYLNETWNKFTTSKIEQESFDF